MSGGGGGSWAAAGDDFVVPAATGVGDSSAMEANCWNDEGVLCDGGSSVDCRKPRP